MSTIPAPAERGNRETGDAASPLLSQPARLCMWALLLIGLLTRLAPLADIDGRLCWQWMSEDGYLMQTIARNVALGLGMSTAEGTIPTNGVQPLATFAFAGLHLLAGGSKLAGVAWVTLMSTLVAAVAGYVVYAVAARVLGPLPHGRELAIVAALLWFASPRIVGHTMNGLETGVYFLAIGCTLAYYLAATADADRPFLWMQRVALGVLLGLSFLARNDAVFFIAGLLSSHVLVGGVGAGGGWRHRIVDAIVAGLISFVVATPWLVNNYMLFGTIVPISGIAQSHSTALGANLLRLPAILFEATTSSSGLSASRFRNASKANPWSRSRRSRSSSPRSPGSGASSPGSPSAPGASWSRASSFSAACRCTTVSSSARRTSSAATPRR